jgi:hypothetical protein
MLTHTDKTRMAARVARKTKPFVARDVYTAGLESRWQNNSHSSCQDIFHEKDAFDSFAQLEKSICRKKQFGVG